MAAEDHTDVLPMLPDAYRGFDGAMRGYDRAQVDAYVARLDDDLRATSAERDTAAGRSADLAAQLASTQAQVESLRRQLRAATETVTAENVDEHVRKLLEATGADAAKLRVDAETHAEQIRNGAADSAARTRASAQKDAQRIVAEATQRLAEADELFRARVAEAEQHRTDVEAQLAASLAQTRTEEDRLTHAAEEQRRRDDEAATAERQRLDSDSAEHRKQAEEDFEITLRTRRSAEAAASAEQKATSAATAATTIADADTRARTMIADATAEVTALHGYRDGVHSALQALHVRLGDVIDATLPARAQADGEPPAAGA